MTMLRVGTTSANLVDCPDPSSMSWGMQDISSPDAGRDDTGEMHKGRIGQKRKLSLIWVNKSPAETAKILQLFNPEYIYVNYHDALLNATITKRFYVGDRSAPMKWWFVGRERYESVTFDIIEK